MRVVGGRRVSDGLRAAAARVAHVEREQLQLVRREAVLVAHHVAVHGLRRSQSATVRHGVPVHLERVADTAVDCGPGTHVPCAGILLVDDTKILKINKDKSFDKERINVLYSHISSKIFEPMINANLRRVFRQEPGVMPLADHDRRHFRRTIHLLACCFNGENLVVVHLNNIKQICSYWKGIISILPVHVRCAIFALHICSI